MDRRLRLRETFDRMAERYDAARPGYPSRTVDDLLDLAGVPPGGRVLEIGCGTGQLTLPLAGRGLTVTAVELGAALGTLAARKLAAMAAAPPSRVLIGAFEEIGLPERGFDLVVAATSFHWLDPTARVARPARLLRPGGALAVIDTQHVAGGSAAFFRAAQACYLRWDPSTPPDLELLAGDRVPEAFPELDRSPWFGPPSSRRYEWELTYTRAEYLTLLMTYSGHLDLPADRRDGLLGCLGELIDDRFGGAITKRYLTELRVARRRVPG